MNSAGACDALARVSWPARVLILAIEAYRVTLSPLLGGHCRFEPSCSRYAQEALERHGARRGLWLGLRRVLRCQPFSRAGYDPVP
jgi:putative membrane protein insertion efficiency factor